MSKIIVCMPVRNEDWILGLSARAVLMWADDLCICDHWSTDKTSEIYYELRDEFPGRVHIQEWRDREWTEMAQRQALLEAARDAHASHIVLVDADEVLTGNLIGQIRRDIEMTGSRTIMQLPWLQLRGGITEQHSAGPWSEQWASFAFRDDPVLHWAQRDGYDFHHRHPMGRQLLPFRPVPRKLGGLMHLQMASERRVKAKAALYKMTEVIRWPGRSTPEQLNAQYDLAVFGRADKSCRDPLPMAQIPKEWWKPYEQLIDKYLKIHAEPWQQKQCRDLWAEHGAEKFAGLDLYGITTGPAFNDYEVSRWPG